MESKAKLFGHPIHPMLIVFPLGLLATSFVFDLVHLATQGARFAEVSFWMITAGLIGGVLAGAFGLVDYFAIPPGTRARRIGLLHGATNLLVIGLFVISWLLRAGAELFIPSAAAIAIAGVAVLLAVVSGWLGGELVDRLAVGVDDGAHVDAPSSLTNRPAAEPARAVGS
jgi:uncharacterized membrane protein